VDKYSHHELTIERATEPVQHLTDARFSIVNGDYHRALFELDEAITEMKIIEQYSDSSTTAHIEQAIRDLEKVENEIRNDSLVIGDLNKAFFNALNSIAYSCMMISENNLDKGEKYKAMRFMNATFAEMIASLKFVNSEELRHKEEKVIEDVRNIISSMKKTNYKYRFNYDTLNHELEELIEF
jgi:hypothetical protein